MMRKVMILATMLALMLVAAAPAFAHTMGGDVDVLAVDASQTAAVGVTQIQNGDADADAGNIGSAANASITNSADISVTQVNAGVGGVAAGDDLFLDFPFVVFF